MRERILGMLPCRPGDELSDMRGDTESCETAVEHESADDLLDDERLGLPTDE